MIGVSVGGNILTVGNSNLYMESSTTSCIIYPQVYLYNEDLEPGTHDYMVPMGRVFTYGSSPWTSYRYSGSLTATSISGIISFTPDTIPLVHAVRNFSANSAIVYAWHPANGVCVESAYGGTGTASYVSASYTGSGLVSDLNLGYSGSFMPAFSIWEDVINTGSTVMSSMSGAIEFFGEGPGSAVGVL